jgi:tripeptide aminopeptidase
VAVCITPDEEIGNGANLFDVKKFGAVTAYTVDGGALGEIEYENFNAANAAVEFNGVNFHPGDAKNKMRNSLLIANEFLNLMPPAETPAHTEGYEGFFHVCGMSGDETQTNLHMLIRDHDRDSFEARKVTLGRIAAYLNSKYGEGTVRLFIKDSYYNMKEMIEPHMELIHNAQAAMSSCGVTPNVVAIRGGTDGARLSFMGLPCPNLSTGGMNYHSILEYVPVESLQKMVEVLVALITMQK